MLALAPQLRAPRGDRAPRPIRRTSNAIAALIFDRGASLPWRTDDPRLTADGVIGDAHAASRELGASDRRQRRRGSAWRARTLAGEPAPLPPYDAIASGSLSFGRSFVTRKNSRHCAGQRREHAPVGVAEIGRHPDREESHDIDDRRGGHARRQTRPPASIACATPKPPISDGKDQPKAGPEQQRSAAARRGAQPAA